MQSSYVFSWTVAVNEFGNKNVIMLIYVYAILPLTRQYDTKFLGVILSSNSNKFKPP